MNETKDLLLTRAKVRAIKRPGIWIPCEVPVLALAVCLRPLRIVRLPLDDEQTDVRWLPETKQYEQRTIRVARRRPRGILARLAFLVPRIVIEGTD